jgi:type IV pilus assembly protein PilN
MPRINLLPWREQQRKERKLAFLVALGAATAAAFVATFAAYLLFNSMIGAQQSRNERLRAEIKILDRQNQEINDLEMQKQRFISRMQVIDKLQRSRSEVVHMFDEVTNLMPDGIYLTSFKQNNKRLRFDGVAQSSTRVSTLMRNIAASQWMRDPELEVVESKKGTTVGNSFVLYADQVTTSGEDDAKAAAAAAAAKRPRRVSGATP